VCAWWDEDALRGVQLRSAGYGSSPKAGGRCPAGKVLIH
jgi:hypothetical protein